MVAYNIKNIIYKNSRILPCFVYFGTYFAEKSRATYRQNVTDCRSQDGQPALTLQQSDVATVYSGR